MGQTGEPAAAIRQIADFDAARALFSPIAHETIEVAAFAYLDPKWMLLGMRQSRALSPTMVDVPMRAVAADALVFDCASVVMAHNHPGGDPAPSDADLMLTKRLARTLDALGVRLLDHLILAGETAISFRALGLL